MKTAGAGYFSQPAVSGDQGHMVKTKVSDLDDVSPSGSWSTVDAKTFERDDCSSTDADTDFETDSESEEENSYRTPNAGHIPAEETLTPEATLLTFDWDDTLLPSTWIRAQGLRLDAESVPADEQRALLDKVANSVTLMFKKAQFQDEVVLVTNAESGWIELNCCKFMPSLYPLLQRIRTVPARSTFEQQAVASPFTWKFLAFESEVNWLCDQAPVGKRGNIISFGDSAHEREAIIRVAEGMTNCCTKSVKFVERPEPGYLWMEHQA